MAKIYKTGKNQLVEQRIIQTLAVITSWLIFFVGILTNNYILMVAVIPTFFFPNTTKIHKAGIEGEKTTLKYLKKLNDDFHIFPNVSISYENKESELDLIVVGKPGIFVIEIKNLKGDISGDFEENHWFQHKIGRKGTKYTQKFYNPTKQVGTHVYRLSKLLKENDIQNWVQGIVFFSNKNSNINVSNGSIPIFKNKKEILDFFNNYETENSLNQEEIDNIVNHIEQIIL